MSDEAWDWRGEVDDLRRQLGAAQAAGDEARSRLADAEAALRTAREALSIIEDFDIDWAVGTGDNVVTLQNIATRALARTAGTIPIPTSEGGSAGTLPSQHLPAEADGLTTVQLLVYAAGIVEAATGMSSGSAAEMRVRADRLGAWIEKLAAVKAHGEERGPSYGLTELGEERLSLLKAINAPSALGQGQGKAQKSASPSTSMKPGQRCTRPVDHERTWRDGHEHDKATELSAPWDHGLGARCPYVQPSPQPTPEPCGTCEGRREVPYDEIIFDEPRVRLKPCPACGGTGRSGGRDAT